MFQLLGEGDPPTFTPPLPPLSFHLGWVRGATASGLANPNSQTGARETFLRDLGKFSGTRVICLMGEVDAAFAIWHRAQRRGTEPVAEMERAVTRYAAFIEQILEMGHDTIVISAPLPTIPDGCTDWSHANLRSEVTATQWERTNMTLRFNERLAYLCSSADAQFVDLDQAALGDDGLVRVDLLNEDPSDHHYHQQNYAAMLAPALRPCLE